MKRKSNGGFSLVEVVVALTILSSIVVPICGSMVLSTRINAKAEAVLQARLAVSSTLEILKNTPFDPDDLPESPEGVTITVDEDTLADDIPYYIVEVAHTDLVCVQTVFPKIPEEPETGGINVE